ncbi:putative oligomerization/nucleic acid binding protein [Jatrophihabitans sp. GAS493]|uniref:SHOCT domain-containing protein n=1 Tax=Jatrophihabitans sp. GAS493 TaxID=1907575 RepID=UPI000BB84584|nr:SHOCT domain-containing protein [Jatrophihabitans sp. GAS493]SOD72469.1 putative oligomerization/nucleic acid binding protein [Jatrophihabitans sp. GAS493]
MAAPLASDYNYPLLNIFWTMLWLFLWILWIFLLIRIISDIFRSEDMNGWVKAIWVIVMIFLPFLGALIYLIARGDKMYAHERKHAEQAEAAAQAYIKSAAGTPTNTADELHKLAELRDRGVLTAAEFDTQKAKLLA